MRSKPRKPRLQHYYFAHVFLREKVFSKPAATVDVLSEESGSQYLKTLWLTAGLTTKGSDDALIDSDGLECSPFLIGDKHRGVIVQFPKPLVPTEAFFVAIVIPSNARKGDKCSCRYFTLELSASDKTVLGEWSDEGLHLNCGPGPPSAQHYFEETVISRVLKEPSDPLEHERKFEEWVDTANGVLEEDEYLTDEEIKVIWNLSKANNEPEFLDFFSHLRKKPRPTLRRGDKEVPNKAHGFEPREEPVKWSREIFGRELLVGEHPLIKLSRIYIIETLRKPLDVGAATVLWGAIFAGAIVRLGSPWWTGVIFASMICVFLFFYLSTSRIRQIRQDADLASSLSGGSGLLDDNDFMQSIAKNTEWTTNVNKLIEAIWGLGLLALIPLMWLFFGAVIGILVSLCSLLITFLFFFFTAKTNTILFKMAVEHERADRLALTKKATRGKGH
jgi:hypothetical protein